MGKVIAIAKVKYDGKKVIIAWTEGEDGEDKYSLECVDEPLAEFKTALSGLAGDVVRICELPAGYVQGLEVRGVSLSEKDGVTRVTITALKTLRTSDAPLILNTPNLPDKPANETAGGKLLPAETLGRVTLVLVEATRYVRGRRAQGNLFEEAGERTCAGCGKKVDNSVTLSTPHNGRKIEMLCADCIEAKAQGVPA